MAGITHKGHGEEGEGEGGSAPVARKGPLGPQTELQVFQNVWGALTPEDYSAMAETGQV